MIAQAPLSRWVGGRVAIVIAACLWTTAAAAGVLFPEPLHVTREIEDPIAESTAKVDEFFTGNRVIRVSGSRVSITDYDRQELTVIDRAAKTYSITSFADIAKARSSETRAQTSALTTAPSVKNLGTRLSAAGSPVDAYEISTAGAVVEVAIDRQVKLSRAAAEAVMGASYPNRRTAQHDATLRAAQTADAYGLASEQTVTFKIAGDSVTQRNRVTHLDRELPLDDLISIPAGAQRVESPIVLLPRLMKQLDELPSEAGRP